MKKVRVILKNVVTILLSIVVVAQAFNAVAEEAIEEVVVVGKSIKASTIVS